MSAGEEFEELEASSATPSSCTTIVSYRKIPYPLSLDARQCHHDYQTGARLKPVFFCPPASGTCQNGHPWAQESPVAAQWVTSKCQVVSRGAVLSQRADIADGLTDCTGRSQREPMMTAHFTHMFKTLISHNLYFMT